MAEEKKETPYEGWGVNEGWSVNEGYEIPTDEAPSFATLTVKDFDPEDQPREKAEAHGCGVLSTADLFAIILRVGVPGTPITTLCRELMKSADGKIHDLERFSREQLTCIPGIGVAKALQIEAVMELIRRYNSEKSGRDVQIRCSQQIYDAIAPHIANLDHEEIWCIFLNRQNRIICRTRFTVGSAVASIFDVKSIIRHALLNRAQGIALCHNHPSGNLSPSPQDDQITRKLKDACKTMEIAMIDHVIATADGFYSYFDNGKL